MKMKRHADKYFNRQNIQELLEPAVGCNISARLDGSGPWLIGKLRHYVLREEDMSGEVELSIGTENGEIVRIATNMKDLDQLRLREGYSSSGICVNHGEYRRVF